MAPTTVPASRTRDTLAEEYKDANAGENRQRCTEKDDGTAHRVLQLDGADVVNRIDDDFRIGRWRFCRRYRHRLGRPAQSSFILYFLYTVHSFY